MWRRFPPAYYRKLQGDEREGGEESRIRAAEKLQDNQDLTAKGEEHMGKHTIDPQISAEHLAGAVRFATVSNADHSLTDYTKFDAFHEYLKETYPGRTSLSLEGNRKIRRCSASFDGASGCCPGR